MYTELWKGFRFFMFYFNNKILFDNNLRLENRKTLVNSWYLWSALLYDAKHVLCKGEIGTRNR